MDRRKFIGSAVVAGLSGLAVAEAVVAQSYAIGISTDPCDPRYTRLASKCTVYLDGFPMEHCFTADERTGEALVIIPDHNLSLFHMERMPEPVWKKGKVEVRGLSPSERQSLRG